MQAYGSSQIYWLSAHSLGIQPVSTLQAPAGRKLANRRCSGQRHGQLENQDALAAHHLQSYDETLIRRRNWRLH